MGKPLNPIASAEPTILVAEDDELAAIVLALTAAKMGVAVETVSNGLEAVERIAMAEPGHYAAVLLDMRMPVMDGRDAARMIRELPNGRGTLQICAMSASEPELVRHPWATWLFDFHLAKPLRECDFRMLLQERALAEGERRPASFDGNHRCAVRERLDQGQVEIDEALARNDFAEAADAARRLRLAVLGLVPEDLIRALHIFQLSQRHGLRKAEALKELLKSVEITRETLLAA